MKSFGFDKLSITGHTKLNMAALNSFSCEVKPVQSKFRFPKATRYKLIHGGILYLYQSWYKGSCYEIDINPNKFKAWEEVQVLLKSILGSGYLLAKIVAVDVNVDIKFDPFAIKAQINPFFLRKIFYFHIKKHLMSGKIEEISFDLFSTLVFGTPRKKSVCVYDCALKHGLPPPLTRIEVRWRGKKRFDSFNLENFGAHLQKQKPFEPIGFFCLTKPKTKKPQMLAKYNHVELLIKENGIKGAKAFINKLIPKAMRMSSYGAVFRSVRRRELHLQKKWSERVGYFIARKARKSFLKEIIKVKGAI